MAILNGDGGNNTITGGSGPDQISGNGGDDKLIGGGGSDTLDGGDDNDWLFSADYAGTFNLPYYNSPYTAPLLDTGSEVDTLVGGAGDDRLFAGYGDNVDGGANGAVGDYLYISFLGAPTGVTADFRLSTQVIGGGTITGIENVSWIQGSNHDDTIYVGDSGPYGDFTAVFGMAGNDTLVAGYYTGTLDGGDGNDIVDGRGSQYLQLVEGGAGDDTLYTNANTFAVAQGGDGNDTIYSHGETHGGAGDDTIVLQYSYYGGNVHGDDGNDTITASAAGNFIFGDAGIDTLHGGDGSDQLDGGTGADLMDGGLGNDTFVVDDIADVVTEYTNQGIDEVRTGLGSATDYSQLFYLPDNVENLTGTSATGQGIWGNDLGNVIATGGGRDLIVLSGRADIAATNTGDDNVSSGGGNDYIFLGAGFDANDRVDGGAGFDTMGLLGNYTLTLDAHSLAGIEKFAVYGSGDATHPNDYEITMADGNVTSGQQMLFVASSLQSGEHLTFTGSAEMHGSFQVLGGHDTDTIVGSAGGDRLYGALGADTLTGGAGNDVFQYNSVLESDATHTDLITDFTAGDKIDLWFVDANSLAGGDQAFSFIGSQAFGHHAGELRADNTSSNHWTISGDVNGDGVADFQLNVTVADSHHIAANDFLL